MEAPTESSEKVKFLLGKGEARFRDLVEQSSDVFWTSDVDGNITYRSPQYKRMFELDPAVNTNRGTWGHVHPDDQPKAIAAVNALREDGKPFSLQYRHLCGDGSYKWVMVSANALFDDQGRQVSHQGIIRDISDLKRNEQHLRESEGRFAGLAASAPVGIFRLDKQLDCVYVNQRLTELNGLLHEQCLGKGYLKPIHPDDKRQAVTIVKAFALDNTRSINDPIELRHVLTHGQINWALVHLAKLRDETGNVIGHVGTVTDITRAKQAEEKLQESESKLKRLLEVASDVIWSADHNLKLTYLSPNFQSKFGLDPALWVGRHPAELIHPDDREAFFAGTDVFQNTEKALSSRECRHLCGDGSYLWVSAIALPVSDEAGNVTGYHGAIREIHERKIAEEALRERERIFSSLARTAPVGIIRFDESGENCVYVNERWSDITGRSPQSALESGYRDFIHPDDLVKFSNVIGASVADPSNSIDNVIEI